jgi:tetratricopeptide (TPR) repeat protein
MQVHPDFNKGLNYLEQLSESTSVFSREGLLLHALSLSFFGNQGLTAEKHLDKNKHFFNNSLLYRYLHGLISMKNRNNEAAIQYFDSCLNFGKDYRQIPLLNYYRAESYLRALKVDTASCLFNLYLRQPSGDEFIKDSYFKLFHLASIYKIQEKNIEEYKNNVLTEGNLNNGSDRYAYNKILNNYIPNETLFKARIQFDGGYYKQSLAILEEKGPSTFIKKRELFEYFYRIARNYQQLNQMSLSIEYFNKVITERETEEYYFWGNSLLNLGNIYALKKEYSLAREYYEKALKYKGEDYRRSIRMEAKSGLKRIEAF